MTRKATAPIVALLLLTSAVGPAAALPFVGSSTAAVSTVTYETGGEVTPSVIVHYSNDSLDSLNAWANESTTRAVISTDTDHGTAVVTAPAFATQDLDLLDRVSAAGSAGFEALTTTPLSAKSFIDAVHPNYQVALDRPDPMIKAQFSPPQIGFTALNDPDFATDGLAFSNQVNESTMADARAAIGANGVSADGSGVTVAVIDTGANVANGRVFGNGTAGSEIRISNASKNTITGESVDVQSGNFTAIEDGSSSTHGTWVASSIGANTSNSSFDGIAPDANLMILKALSDEGSGSTADITEAIRHAADNGADIISMSLGSPLYSEAQADAVEYAYENGVNAVVVATGNSRYVRGTAIASPADVERVISVGATTAQPASKARSAYFSQVGPDPATTDNSGGASAGMGVDVAAPGFKVTAQVPDEAGAVAESTLSGTSMATPLVSAGIAVELDSSGDFDAGPETVESELENASRAVPNAAAVEVGSGMLAVDNFDTGTAGGDQTEAMDDAAQQRNAFYKALSDASGGILSDIPVIGGLWT